MAAAVAAAQLAACSNAAPPTRASDVGVTAGAIVVGGTAPLSGPHAGDGTIVKAADAYLQYVNAKGGVHGRKIRFTYLDDTADEAQTATLTRQLVEQDDVFITFAGIGTDEQLAVRDYLKGAQVPQVFPVSGAGDLPGWQPSYQTEGEVYGAYAAAKLHTVKIGVILDHSVMAKETLSGLEKGLGAKAPLVTGKEFNDGDGAAAVGQLAKFKSAGMDALVVLQSPKAAILTLVAADRIGWHPRIFLSAEAQAPVYLKEAQRDAGNDRLAVNGILSARFLRSPDDVSMTLYRQVMARYYPSGDVNDARNVYGMGLAYSLVDVLGRAGDHPTRRAVLDAIAHLDEADNPCLLPGVVLTGPAGRAGTEQIVRYDAASAVYKPVGGMITPAV